MSLQATVLDQPCEGRSQALPFFENLLFHSRSTDTLKNGDFAVAVAMETMPYALPDAFR